MDINQSAKVLLIHGDRIGDLANFAALPYLKEDIALYQASATTQKLVGLITKIDFDLIIFTHFPAKARHMTILKNIRLIAQQSCQHLLIGTEAPEDDVRQEVIALKDCRILVLNPINELVLSELIQYEIRLQRNQQQCLLLLTEMMRNGWHVGSYDILTGLVNRTTLHERLEKAIGLRERYNTHFAILHVNIDNFNRHNEVNGYQGGDIILSTVAERLKDITRDTDTLARAGSDEFIILLNNITLPEHVANVARYVLKVISDPIQLSKEMVELTASIGIVLCPETSCQECELLQFAEIAMREAKKKSGNHFLFFQDSLNEAIITKNQLLHDLRLAVRRQEFEVYIQPQYCLQSQRMIGAEALVRWYNSVRGFVRPDFFIPLAEESGFINMIGRFVLNTVMQCLPEILPQVDPDFHLAVNVSPKQLHEEYFLNDLQGYARANAPLHALVIEITEGVFINEASEIQSLLTTLQNLGIKISLDDFGTGYSCLSYLSKLPIDILKIDKSFIGHACEGIQELGIVKSIISIAHHMEITVVAEGVEKVKQAEILTKEGCEMGQGYLWAKPMPLKEFMVQLQDLKYVHSR